MPEYFKNVVPSKPEELPEFFERELIRIQDLQEVLLTKIDALKVFSIAGYGGIRLAAPPLIGNDITGVLQQIVGFDAATIVSPKGITQDVPGDQLIVDVIGKWVFNIFINIEHNEMNQGRTFDIQLWNASDSLELGLAVMAVGRNTPGTNISISVLTEVDESLVGKDVQIRAGNASSNITNVIINSMSWSIFSVGEFSGTLEQLQAL